MDALLSRWEGRCAKTPVLRFVDINLRGFGQVMFQDNPLTGLIFLVAVAWGAVAAGARRCSLPAFSAWSRRP